MSDDDWFERALREDEDDDTPADSDEANANDEADSVDSTDSDDPAEPFDSLDSAGTAGTDPAGESADASDGETVDPDSGATESEAPDDEPFDDPFDDDFATAFESAPDPDDSGGFGGAAGGDDAVADDAFGFGDDSFGGGGGGGGTDFDEENFESDIERLDVGVEGLDEMILGGVPARSLIAGIGSAGTGKTTLGLQFLREALENDERAVYITLEESRQRILDTADEKGWDFSTYVEEGQLAIIDLDPIEMANSLSSIRDDLPRLVEEFDASRLVLDSVSLLEMMYDRPSRRRSEVFGFTRALKQAGVTTLMTSEAAGDSAYTSRYGIIEYLADAVFILQYVRPSDFRETRLAIEIQKIRDANHSRETKPYELTADGISVYRQANIF